MSDVSIQEQAKIAGTQGQRQAKTNNNRWRTDLTGWGFVAPFLLVFILFLLWPIILGFRMSFYNWSLGRGALEFLGLDNYARLFADPAFWSSLWHTIFFTIYTTPILVILGFLLALLINRAIPAQWLFRTIFFAPFVLPVSVISLIWNWLYQPGFGLINGTLAFFGGKDINWLSDPNVAMTAVVILTVWWTVGFNFVLYLAGMQQIPSELYEAAAIDGAGYWSRVRYIMIPQLSRITSLIVILQVIASLRVFDQIYLLLTGGPNYSTRPIIEYVYDAGFTSFRIGYASAMSYVFFVVILLVSLLQFSLFMRPGRNN